MKRRALSVFGSQKNVSGSPYSTVADRLTADAKLLAQRAFRRETVSANSSCRRRSRTARTCWYFGYGLKNGCCMPCAPFVYATIQM
jgi:hypothetical protein